MSSSLLLAPTGLPLAPRAILIRDPCGVSGVTTTRTLSIGTPITSRVLAADPVVTVHLDSGTDVVIVEGHALGSVVEPAVLADYDRKGFPAAWFRPLSRTAVKRSRIGSANSRKVDLRSETTTQPCLPALPEDVPNRRPRPSPTRRLRAPYRRVVTLSRSGSVTPTAGPSASVGQSSSSEPTQTASGLRSR